MTELVSPNQNPVIRKYLKDVQAWHGYIRFLGMPSLQKNPDVPIDELYVSQSLSLESLPTEKEPRPEQLQNPIKLLLEKHHLVILGDPGSGKSTLINWFAWQLASGFVDRLPKELSSLVPIPIVLRELKLEGVNTFDGLINAFLERPIARCLRDHKNLLLEYLSEGKALLLIDGLDEVSLEVRHNLRQAFFGYFVQFNSCYSLFTSRKVGYELAPISFSKNLEYNNNKEKNKGDSDLVNIAKDFERLMFELISSKPLEVYIAPFTDGQISRFSLNWYRENTTGNSDGAHLLRDEFVASIESNESTLQLARTPQLLTMMALIFKVRLQLPNGRALLYDLIAQAYLESIDTARKLKDPHIWQHKKRWLARIGFEMQLRRSTTSSDNNRSVELLVDKSEILEWLASEMKQTGVDSVNEKYAESYLDWIARRSGLLLPRGEGQFAFLHLSFQEYFSAIYIQQQVENPDYFFSDESEYLDKRFSGKPLRHWVSNIVWNQTFVFLFELISANLGLVKRIWEECFPIEIYEKQYDTTKSRLLDYNFRVANRIPEIELLVGLIANPHVAINDWLIQNSLSKLLRLAIFEQECLSKLPVDLSRYVAATPLLSRLVSIDRISGKVIENIEVPETCESLYVEATSMIHIEKLLNVFSAKKPLKGLMAFNCGAVNVDKFAKYNFDHLVLDMSDLENPNDISILKSLRMLSICVCGIQNVDCLSGLQNLDSLFVSYNKLNDISSLAKLEALRHLSIEGNEIKDLNVLGRFNSLRFLSCSEVVNLEPLTKIPHLIAIRIFDSPLLKEIKPLGKIKTLKHVFLVKTGVVNRSKNFGLRKDIDVSLS